jgi:hypothetical protein
MVTSILSDDISNLDEAVETAFGSLGNQARDSHRAASVRAPRGI